MPDTYEEIKAVVEELKDDHEVVDAFIELNDLIREKVEERLDTIKARKVARNKIVRHLYITYW